jgi:hypothetical protein
MRLTHTQPPTPEDLRPRINPPRLHTDHPRLHKALVWLGLVAVAVFPFPWWW